LAALCGIAPATASVPAIFAVAASTMEPAPPLRAGPLTVARADDLAAVLVERAALRLEALGFLEDVDGFRAAICTPC